MLVCVSWDLNLVPLYDGMCSRMKFSTFATGPHCTSCTSISPYDRYVGDLHAALFVAFECLSERYRDKYLHSLQNLYEVQNNPLINGAINIFAA